MNDEDRKGADGVGGRAGCALEDGPGDQPRHPSESVRSLMKGLLDHAVAIRGQRHDQREAKKPSPRIARPAARQAPLRKESRVVVAGDPARNNPTTVSAPRPAPTVRPSARTRFVLIAAGALSVLVVAWTTGSFTPAASRYEIGTPT